MLADHTAWAFLTALRANKRPTPTRLCSLRCLSAAFLAHGDLSQSPEGIGSSLPSAWRWLMLYGEPPDAIAISDKRLTNKGGETQRESTALAGSGLTAG